MRTLIGGMAILVAMSGVAFAQIKSANELTQDFRDRMQDQYGTSYTIVQPSPRGYEMRTFDSDGSITTGQANRLPNGGYENQTYPTSRPLFGNDDD